MPRFEVLAALLFALAVLHTFASSLFHKLAARSRHHHGLWEMLGEVEVVFGVWSLLLMGLYAAYYGAPAAVDHVQATNYTEPVFVFTVMLLASSKPVIDLAYLIILLIARRMPGSFSHTFFWTAMTLGPLLGSFITEPAAMTLLALILYSTFFREDISLPFRYAIVGVLFVNISVGGVLTHFAAPPVVMVAQKWGLTMATMFATYGWKAMVAVVVNSTALTFLFRREIAKLRPETFVASLSSAAPLWVSAVHLLFLAAAVVFSHHVQVLVAVVIFFLGFVQAYERHQDELMVRGSLLVAFFLAGLVTLGNFQRWWLEPLLARMDALALYLGATGLTAITDNAALTYLGSLVDHLSEANKYALLAGAVTGGGLTVIANAPNPAGYAILKNGFPHGVIGAGKMLLAALAPTTVAALCFWFLP